ncbi:hypothetical protein AKJ52_02950 [candidate division MSBL1 archaeon SCGC-AAA382C18]|uniref:Uncharacterized protein n=1 Tax=candidate division MSBL1 archaeon SCGC-AAA382C18 TaxID=1698281 RepID=A0A133VHA7_9EURY|nr:hypothetical protein AKJ52_02950 [candidate division MSBL1 archaeon SCGC-AAA382C18]
MEFWNDRIIEKSWRTLLELNEMHEFILIGGWAAYLHTKSVKSKDIDIIADYDVLEEFKLEYDLKKNQRLKKYETIMNDVSIDIYVPYFSDLVLPVEDLSEYTVSLEGMKVLNPEPLLILKQQAELDRSQSVKGQKDRTDILNLLINGDVDLEKYTEILSKYGLEEYGERLGEIVRDAKKEFSYLGIENLRKRKLIKEEITERLEELRIRE